MLSARCFVSRHRFWEGPCSGPGHDSIVVSLGRCRHDQRIKSRDDCTAFSSNFIQRVVCRSRADGDGGYPGRKGSSRGGSGRPARAGAPCGTMCTALHTELVVVGRSDKGPSVGFWSLQEQTLLGGKRADNLATRKGGGMEHR